MTPVEIHEGTSPVILGLPHTGTYVPNEIHVRLNARGQELADTDWHIHTLYDGLLADATTVRATFHRYVIDANRGPDDASLYPGQNTTGLVPTTDFDGTPIWREGEERGRWRGSVCCSVLDAGVDGARAAVDAAVCAAAGRVFWEPVLGIAPAQRLS